MNITLGQMCWTPDECPLHLNNPQNLSCADTSIAVWASDPVEQTHAFGDTDFGVYGYMLNLQERVKHYGSRDYNADKLPGDAAILTVSTDGSLSVQWFETSYECIKFWEQNYEAQESQFYNLENPDNWQEF